MFFFNDTATTEIYTLSLHDAPSDLAQGEPAHRLVGAGWLPELYRFEHLGGVRQHGQLGKLRQGGSPAVDGDQDRKSTRLNSSHANTSYAVFCLKKKKSTISSTSIS